MARTGNKEQEAARLHYIYCPDCSEYKSHTIVPGMVCRGNCGLTLHDDPTCPLAGKLIDPSPVDTSHVHKADCFDC